MNYEEKPQHVRRAGWSSVGIAGPLFNFNELINFNTLTISYKRNVATE